MLFPSTAPATLPAPVPIAAPARLLPAAKPETILCEACGTRFHKSRACRIGNSDYCPSCDEERWLELTALQERLSYGRSALLSDVLDHSFAEMF